jgi:hypothetical protein
MNDLQSDLAEYCTTFAHVLVPETVAPHRVTRYSLNFPLEFKRSELRITVSKLDLYYERKKKMYNITLQHISLYSSGSWYIFCVY